MVGLHTASTLDLDSLSVPLTEASAHFLNNALTPAIKRRYQDVPNSGDVRAGHSNNSNVFERRGERQRLS